MILNLQMIIEFIWIFLTIHAIRCLVRLTSLSLILNCCICFGAGVLSDVHAVRYPKEVMWSQGQQWLVDIYDWDLVIVEQHVTSILSFGIKLCVGLAPCSMRIKGSPVGQIKRQGSGYISCLISNECKELSLEDIVFTCDYSESPTHNTALKIQGSYLAIVNSSFTACASIEDGGVIKSFDKATVMISDSSFHDLRSTGFGGAIASHGGNVHVFNSYFSETYAFSGGGAIWTSVFQSCYGTSEYHDTVLEIINSSFSQIPIA
jgi:hypothetical protein